MTRTMMAEASALWDLLRQSTDPAAADALKNAVEVAPDRSLNRINPLVFAAEHGLNEEAAIGALVHAARLGSIGSRLFTSLGLRRNPKSRK